MFVTLAATAVVAQVRDLLPDITLLPRYLASAYVTTTNSELPPGTRALRFSTASYNPGEGRLEMRGGEVVGNLQRVYQRVFRSDNSWYDREAGWFIFHPTHGHIHFEDWTAFRLRNMTPAGTVGDIIAVGSKTSFCILEIIGENPFLPGHNTPPDYGSCGQIQGLRPGWADVYGSSLPGQYIELTGVPDGVYWLEGDIDPNGQVLESNETNNRVRIPVGVGNPPAAQPDAYETNNSLNEVKSKPVGGQNSPNLGTVYQRRTIRDLSVTDAEDWFSFKLDKPGGDGDFVRAESPWLRQGSFSMQLFNAAGTQLRSSAESYNWEEISLSGLTGGTYYVRVLRSGNTSNPNYWLTIEPAGPVPPRQRFDGGGGNDHGDTTYIEKAHDFIPVAWKPIEGSPAVQTASIYRSRTTDPGDAVVVDGYEHMPGHIRAANVNTVQFAVGEWHLMLRSFGTGSFSDEWLDRKVVIYYPGDIDFDGRVTLGEARTVERYVRKGMEMPEAWGHICDIDHDKDVDMADVKEMYRLAGG
ncbi:MAG: hypothetical protein IT207_08610 [Fimbriimonadaceae bacterium]|nr:hypothetical protein [Fimbriimonadaceae bacterium]